MIAKHTTTLVTCILIAMQVLQAQRITMLVGQESIPIAEAGVIRPQFSGKGNNANLMDCGMPKLYIQGDSSHDFYSILAAGATVESITARWNEIQSEIQCKDSTCTVTVNNLCPLDNKSHTINWITLETSIGAVDYLVNCNPSAFYKPFEWGLLILVVFAAVALTLSAMHSKAWSYHGYGFELTTRNAVGFNVLVMCGIVLAWVEPEVFGLTARVVGTVIGAMGVMVCTSETLWLTRYQPLKQKIWGRVRRIDLVSALTGVLMVGLYWLFNGQWLINDILGVCSIVALMKLVKVTSLLTGVCLVGGLLGVEVVVGLFVHYVIRLSYNNYVINLFQNPLMLTLPAITPQLYRQCAWLPITSVLFPGLILSFLRRFDLTRGTLVYLLIGLISFYVGSIAWMIVDMETVHALPFAIISEPVTLLVVMIQSTRRNEFKTLWRGNFHDEELKGHQEVFLSRETEIMEGVTPSQYVDLTATLKLPRESDTSTDYDVVRFETDQL